MIEGRRLLGLALVALAACKDHPPSPTPAPSGTSTSTAAATPPLRARGTTGRIFRVLAKTRLEDGQKVELAKITREAMAADAARSGDAGVDDVLATLDAIAREFREGALDEAKVAAHEAAFARKDALRHDRDVVALNQVQRLLTQVQRAGLVQEVKTAEARRNRTSEATEKRRREVGFVDYERFRLNAYVKDLGLTPEQRARVDQQFPPRPTDAGAPTAEDGDAKAVEAMLNAFLVDGFDANRFTVDQHDPRAIPMFGLARFMARITPILEPKQREKMAAQVTEPPPRRGQEDDD